MRSPLDCTIMGTQLRKVSGIMQLQPCHDITMLQPSCDSCDGTDHTGLGESCFSSTSRTRTLINSININCNLTRQFNCHLAGVGSPVNPI